MLTNYIMTLWSENPEALVEFYQNVLGMTLKEKLELPDDWGFGLVTTGGGYLWIGKHSEIKGKNTEPFRFIITFFTDDFDGDYAKIAKAPGVTIVAEPFQTPPDPKRRCFTFLDPEGNCVQLLMPRTDFV